MFILLLLVCSTLNGSSLSYYPDRNSFTFVSENMYINSYQEVFNISYGNLEAGLLSDRYYERLYSPFTNKAELEGLAIRRNEREFFLLEEPALSTGCFYFGKVMKLAFAFDLKNESKEAFLLRNDERGLGEGFRGDISFDLAGLTLGSTFGFFPSVGGRYVLKCGIKRKGFDVNYAFGVFPGVGRVYEEYVSVAYKSKYIDILYIFGKGSEPVKVGNWRERYSRERIAVKYGNGGLVIDQRGTFSKTGKLSFSSVMTIYCSRWTVSWNNLDVMYLSYRKRNVSLRIGTDLSWRLKFSFERKKLNFNFTFSSDGKASCYLNYSY